jgi:hypothetical protein
MPNGLTSIASDSLMASSAHLLAQYRPRPLLAVSPAMLEIWMMWPE